MNQRNKKQAILNLDSVICNLAYRIKVEKMLSENKNGSEKDVAESEIKDLEKMLSSVRITLSILENN